MGNVLARNFEGEHRWITDERYNPEAKIDAMFFPITGEALDDNNYDKSYKDR